MTGGSWIGAFVLLWIRPRATIRRIVDADPHRFVIGIAWIAGALVALEFQDRLSSGELPANVSALIPADTFGPFAIAIFAFFLGLMGVSLVYGSGWLYRWSGHVLGGSATVAEVRAAIAWAQVPTIYLTSMDVLANIFGAATPSVTAAAGNFTLWALIRAAFTLWSFIISLKMLGEVHRFSAWRALGTVLFGTVAVMVATVAVVLAVGLAIFVARGIA